jgi:hypothetical protein
MEQPALFAVLLSFGCHLAFSAGNSGELIVSRCCTLSDVQLLILFAPVVQSVTLLQLLLSQGSAVTVAHVTCECK